jgi:hypothetical protein
MSDFLARATSKAPPIVGEGCVRRYDPRALSGDHGAAFAEARALWESLNEAAAAQPIATPGGERAAEPAGTERW